jgi:hypothetical protein
MNFFFIFFKDLSFMHSTQMRLAFHANDESNYTPVESPSENTEDALTDHNRPIFYDEKFLLSGNRVLLPSKSKVLLVPTTKATRHNIKYTNRSPSMKIPDAAMGLSTSHSFNSACSKKAIESRNLHASGTLSPPQSSDYILPHIVQRQKPDHEVPIILKSTLFTDSMTSIRDGYDENDGKGTETKYPRDNQQTDLSFINT